MKTALITGITGQDGAYLAKFLLKKNYKVVGTVRRTSSPNLWRLKYLGIIDKVELVSLDLADFVSVSRIINEVSPDEIYNLGAQSFVGISFDQPMYTTEVTGSGILRILEAVKFHNKKIKIYQASSSEMYGNEKTKIKNENTPFAPVSPYAIAKLYAYHMALMYRNGYGIHVSNGILFNHESSLRGLEFVTRKITNGVAKISLDIDKTLSLGNIDSMRDWGYAPDYIEGMWMMLQQKQPSDYVLATNKTHSVKEFLEETCRLADVRISKIKINKNNFRPCDVEILQGDYKKAEKHLNWKPKVTFKKLVKIMVEEDITRWERWLKGETFPWDISVGK